MDYENIINNILIESEETTHCMNALNKLSVDDIPAIQLLLASRYHALERADLINQSNITTTLIEILNEIESLILPQDYPSDNNIDDNSIVSLQLSSIIDTVLQNFSKNDRKIYLQRYLCIRPIDNIALECNCSPSNITEVISSINSSLKTELKNTNIQCSSRTVLESFTDIANDNLMLALDNNASINNTKNSDSSTNNINRSKKLSYKKIINICLSTLIVILSISAIYLFVQYKKINADKQKESTSEKNKDNAESADYSFIHLFTSNGGSFAVNAYELLSYSSSTSDLPEDEVYETEHFSSLYYSIELDSSIPLEMCLGEKIESISSDDTSYYKLLGHDGVIYLIKKSPYRYLLYSCSTINPNCNPDEVEGDISYSEILNNFYGLTASNQIKTIDVNKAYYDFNFNDTFIQKRIDEPTDLNNIFSILSECTYDYTLDINPTDNNPLTYDYLMNTSVQLYIELYNGTIIDTLYYRPGYNYFFDGTTYMVFKPNAENTTNTISNYLDTMLGYNNHMREPISSDLWEIDVILAEATNTDICIAFGQTNEHNNIAGLYAGADFILEKYENNTWTELTYNDYYFPQTNYQFCIPLYIDSMYSVKYCHIEDKYNLPNTGKYRLTFTIYDGNSKDIYNPVSRDYSIEFELTENMIDE